MLENTATNDTVASQTTIDDQVEAPMSSNDSEEVTSESTKSRYKCINGSYNV